MMQKDRYVAFVCTGNTCRSPMAEAIFNKLAEEKGLNVGAVSFGMAAANGVPASFNAQKACEEIGIDLSDKKANFIFNFNIAQFERFYVMTDEHKMMLRDFCSIPEEKITVLNISDPFGGNLDVYRACRDEIYNSIKEIIKEYEDTENDPAAP